MEKKSTGNSEPPEALSEQTDGYVVGQISGSLFPKKSTSGSSHLAALFKTESSASSVLFVPAPKPVVKATEKNWEDAGSTGPIVQTQKKATKKEKTAAEKTVENRESALQNADEEEDGVRKVSKKSKRKAVEMVRGGLEEEEGKPARKKKDFNMAEERIKNKRTVFVGNLPVSCTRKALQLLFKELGPIESIRFRSVTREDASMSLKVAAIQRKVHPKRHNINAYVVFKTEEGAQMALQRNGLEIEKGFHIRVDRTSKSASHDHKRSIFVGNLPYDINELPLREHFEECGNVEAVRLVRDRNSGMGKGFGYVLFESIDAVQLALKLDNSQLDGRKIRVKRSVKKEKLKNTATGKGPRAGAAKGPRAGAAKGPRAGAAKGPRAGAAKGPGKGEARAKDSGKAAGTQKGPKRGGFKGRPGKGPQSKPYAGPAQRRFGKPMGGGSFKGEMVTAGGEKAKQGKGLKKKKLKARKRDQAIHI
ncbi:hypothetical protein SKAU_G00154700 [Synaphobranchus kaupii]|uniref:RRM domain-containing protein n=1 Tax=Synaphobranchus kaupii TaxID=118154 RepID=A0A9Q1FHC7_SYNKA|nr:hypothetical protein SKAU_G00154700 [Synaphobranchus kaupii]